MRADESLSRGGTKATDDELLRPGLGRGLWQMYFTWRNIALFVIAFLIVSYLMLLGIIITIQPVRF
jgi:hypothetical protein